MIDCIGVRFENGPKLHYVEVPATVPAVGRRVVVSIKRGLELGLVRTSPRTENRASGHFVREALLEDVQAYEALKVRAEELKWLLKALAREQGKGFKIVHLEFTLDEQLLVVNYSSDAQPALRSLAQELMKHTSARVEFVNVGPRDQSRILGALGACGTGTCSSVWLQSFNAVGIRMARDQQLPLNPDKISGPCGRLMCCLQFEHEMYEQLLKTLPRKGGRACHTGGDGCGRVVKLHPLKQTVELALESGGVNEYRIEDIERGERGQS